MNLIGGAFYTPNHLKLYQDEEKFFLKNDEMCEELEMEEIQSNMANPWSSLSYYIEINTNTNEPDYDENKKYICFCISVVYDGIEMDIYGFGKTPAEALKESRIRVESFLKDYKPDEDED